MSTSAHDTLTLQQASAAMAKLRPVAEVAHDLGIRTEVELPRLPGVVDWARTVADALGLTATVEICADGVCVRFSPSPLALARERGWG
jgi:hypothetical protein